MTVGTSPGGGGAENLPVLADLDRPSILLDISSLSNAIPAIRLTTAVRAITDAMNSIHLYHLCLFHICGKGLAF